jgi:hypothetical protein
VAEKFDADLVVYTDPETGRRTASRLTPICDFCCGDPCFHPIKWSYPAGRMPLMLHGPMQWTDTPWSACDVCHALIEDDEWEKLAERIRDVQSKRFDMDAQHDHETVLAHLHRFRDAREGPALAEGEYDPKTGYPPKEDG